MEIGFLSVLLLGFLLGIKHAIEPDHVIAVSTIASRSKNLLRSGLAGVFWGIGHTATLLVAGIALYFVHDRVDEGSELAMSLEFLVGIMLFYLGIAGIRTFRGKIHSHPHRHSGEEHAHFHYRSDAEHRHGHGGRTYWKSVAIGLVHGLAGSAAMALLTMETVDSLWGSIVYIIVFGAGTVLGMLLFTTVIGIPFVLSSRRETVNRGLTALTGTISMLYGLYYMYNLGVTEGLFRMWLS